MKKLNKKKIVIISIVILLICLIPIRHDYNDGGTKEYQAVLYKVIVWHQMYTETGEENPYEVNYHTGTDIYIFPFNFGEKEWHE